ncbi:MAG: hypothetical protein ACOC0P_08170, partial [Planctomycetota bacterium]
LPAPLPDLEQRAETRATLFEGPIGQFAAWQISTLELATFVTAAERPSLSEDLKHILDTATRGRLDAGSVSAQLLSTELAMLRVRAVRLGVGDAVDGARAPMPSPSGPDGTDNTDPDSNDDGPLAHRIDGVMSSGARPLPTAISSDVGAFLTSGAGTVTAQTPGTPPHEWSPGAAANAFAALMSFAPTELSNHRLSFQNATPSSGSSTGGAVSAIQNELSGAEPTETQPAGIDAGDDTGSASTADRAPGSASTSFADRLRELSTENPREWFVLGEDLAESGDVETAIRLFVIAAELAPQEFGRSSALALAAIEFGRGHPQRGMQLRGIAGMFPLPKTAGRYPGSNGRVTVQPPPTLTPTTAASSSSTAGSSSSSSSSSSGAKGTTPTSEHSERYTAEAMVSAMFGFYRLGEGAMALKALDLNPNAHDVLRRYTNRVASSAEIINWCRANDDCDVCNGDRIIQCRECRGRRTTDRRCSTCGDDHFVICTRCGGTPGPASTMSELDLMLQFELMLLAPESGTWTDQFAFDAGHPLPVLDPAALPTLYALDPQATIWRNGTWQRPGS